MQKAQLFLVSFLDRYSNPQTALKTTHMLKKTLQKRSDNVLRVRMRYWLLQHSPIFLPLIPWNWLSYLLLWLAENPVEFCMLLKNKPAGINKSSTMETATQCNGIYHMVNVSLVPAMHYFRKLQSTDCYFYSFKQWSQILQMKLTVIF